MFINDDGFGALVFEEGHRFADFHGDGVTVKVDVVSKTHTAAFNQFAVGVAGLADITGLMGIIAAPEG